LATFSKRNINNVSVQFIVFYMNITILVNIFDIFDNDNNIKSFLLRARARARAHTHTRARADLNINLMERANITILRYNII